MVELDHLLLGDPLAKIDSRVGLEEVLPQVHPADQDKTDVIRQPGNDLAEWQQALAVEVRHGGNKEHLAPPFPAARPVEAVQIYGGPGEADGGEFRGLLQLVHLGGRPAPVLPGGAHGQPVGLEPRQVVGRCAGLELQVNVEIEVLQQPGGFGAVGPGIPEEVPGQGELLLVVEVGVDHRRPPADDVEEKGGFPAEGEEQQAGTDPRQHGAQEVVVADVGPGEAPCGQILESQHALPQFRVVLQLTVREGRGLKADQQGPAPPVQIAPEFEGLDKDAGGALVHDHHVPLLVQFGKGDKGHGAGEFQGGTQRSGSGSGGPGEVAQGGSAGEDTGVDRFQGGREVCHTARPPWRCCGHGERRHR